jgi:hypothetical protein
VHQSFAVNVSWRSWYLLLPPLVESCRSRPELCLRDDVVSCAGVVEITQFHAFWHSAYAPRQLVSPFTDRRCWRHVPAWQGLPGKPICAVSPQRWRRLLRPIGVGLRPFHHCQSLFQKGRGRFLASRPPVSVHTIGVGAGVTFVSRTANFPSMSASTDGIERKTWPGLCALTND